METLKNEGNKLDLIDTILSYIENSGEINTISKNLNIHRNTLNYRLEKIYSLTGKNPKNFLDLLELYTSYILYNWDCASEQKRMLKFGQRNDDYNIWKFYNKNIER